MPEAAPSDDPRGAPLHPTRLDGRVALVTGSGQNIGRAIAIRLAEAGASVIVNGANSREKVDGTVAAIREAGGTAHGIMADVSEPAQVKEMVAEAIATFGKVDIAVSNVSRRLHKPFETITIEDWDWAIRTNLSSCFYLAHEVVPGMKDRGWGRIIHVSGYDGFTGHLTNRAYNIAAKSGMHGLSKAIGKELGPHGITANTLVPGAIDTSRDWSQYPNTVVEDVRDRVPVRRWGHVDDLAYGAVYLCTTGGFVNGQALHLNGGDYMF
ncbi:3-oxoacyl-[acyl-carrier protein] reductase [Albimonas donghaensis]|uniref:3-oxoacyl-[acyl-carrier protein] reductase n=1 Tax=Albimonas donghaensis TaxID=356660 RepID=A0A1H2QW03_9RHOB|nr:SDR family oxidoreductase [Albimonas donghaensis]SDW10629.1 3-oxoacyl-[acyl-carrier protein] reductase [Albimonas donghaensis]